MFEHLKKLEVTAEQTIWIELAELRTKDNKVARLQCRPMAEVNGPYFADMVRMGANRSRRLQKGENLTPEMIAANRADDRRLMPRHVVVGWENIPNREGSPVPFTQENLEDFFRWLPDQLLDRLRNEAGTLANFGAGELDPEARSGNSLTGSAGS